MLIWMRNSTFAGAMKFVLMGMLLLALVGLVFTGAGGFFTGNLSSNTVVKGGGVNIEVNDFDRTVQRALSSQGTQAPEAFRLGLIDQILRSEIQNRLFTNTAHDLGLKVDDTAVTKKIAQLAEPLATEGRSKKEALRQILMTQGISESEFVSTIRTEMGNSLLRAAIQPPASLQSPLMAQTMYRYDNETRTADIVFLKNASVTGVTAPTDEQLQKYYEANKQSFLIPESRTITIGTLKTDMLKKNVAITDARLKQEYDKEIESFRKQPRRVVEQSVSKTKEDAELAVAAFKAGQKVQNSNTQEYERDGLLLSIAEPVFNGKKGDVIGPIETGIGWHALVIRDILPESVTPFEQVKEKLRDEVERIALTEELFNAGNTIEDRAAAGDKFEDIVSEYGMTTESIGPFRVNGNNKDGKDLFAPYANDREKLIQAAFDVDNGEIAPIVETADGQFHLIHVDQVTPDAYRDFASVRAGLEKQWMDEQRKLANKDRAKTGLDELAAGKTLADIAKKEGASVNQIGNIRRNNTPSAPLNAIAAAQIFTTDIGKGFSSEVEGGYIIGTVTDAKLPPAKNASEQEKTELLDLTGRSLSQEISQEYVRGLANGKKIKINQALLEQKYSGQKQQPQQ